jgi:tetratricopeptide (TPR) repeat protein
MKLRTLAMVTTVVAGVSLGQIDAWAQPDDANAIDAQARQLYLEGESHYAAGRYADAAEAFERAYQLSRKPALLFNLGNAYERLGRFDKAAETLQEYLRSPKARGVDLVRQRIERLNRAHMRQQQEEAEAAAVAKRAAEAEAAASKKTPVLWPAYTAFGVSAAAFATMITFGVLSQSAGSDAKDLCTDDGFCPIEADDDLSKEKTFAVVSDVMLGVGIASAGVGIFLLVRALLATNDGEEESAEQAGSVSFIVSPAPSGAEVGLVARF